MNTRAEFLEFGLAGSTPVQSREAVQEAEVAASAAWDIGEFAQEQVLRLVRQVFSPGRKNSARQVIFSAVDASADVGAVCLHVGRALADQVHASVCVVEGKSEKGGSEFDRSAEVEVPDDWQFGELRKSCYGLSSNLWLLPGACFWGNRADDNGLRNRLGELRLEFDYTVVQGPPASVSSETAVLGNSADGVVLLLEANSTRRAAAQNAKEMLQQWNARLLGVVLAERTFPIPERLYRRL
jgi:hypothetical protein